MRAENVSIDVCGFCVERKSLEHMNEMLCGAYVMCIVCVYVYLNPFVFVYISVKPVRLSTYMHTDARNIWGFELLSNKIGLALIFQSQFFRSNDLNTN